MNTKVQTQMKKVLVFDIAWLLLILVEHRLSFLWLFFFFSFLTLLNTTQQLLICMIYSIMKNVYQFINFAYFSHLYTGQKGNNEVQYVYIIKSY